MLPISIHLLLLSILKILRKISNWWFIFHCFSSFCTSSDLWRAYSLRINQSKLKLKIQFKCGTNLFVGLDNRNDKNRNDNSLLACSFWTIIKLQSKGGDVASAVEWALNCGYRLIDTACSYRNEKEIGDVLQKFFKSGNLKREDIFITTKVSWQRNLFEIFKSNTLHVQKQNRDRSPLFCLNLSSGRSLKDREIALLFQNVC